MQVEVWDLMSSTLDPVHRLKHDCKLSCTLFSPNSPVVVVGDENGCVCVYKLDGLAPVADLDHAQQVARLEKVMSPSVLEP